MKTATLAPAFALLGLVACSGLSTNLDYDTSYSFENLREYAWVEKQDSSIGSKRVRDAVDATLRERGFVRVEKDPDFLVAAYVSTQERLRVVDWGYTSSPGHHWYGGSNVDVWQYEEGTLVIDVVDPKESELVWRGSASKAVDPDWTPEQRNVEARKAAQKLLAEFPPQG